LVLTAGIALLLAAGTATMTGLTAFAAGAPSLGTAAGFTVLGGAGVTCTASTVAGLVGSSLTVTQTPSCTIAAVDAGDTVATTAVADFGAAYGVVAAMTCDPANNLTGQELGGMTLSPNVYCFNTTADLTSGTLTLNGPADGIWIFQIEDRHHDRHLQRGDGRRRTAM